MFLIVFVGRAPILFYVIMDILSLVILISLLPLGVIFPVNSYCIFNVYLVFFSVVLYIILFCVPTYSIHVKEMCSILILFITFHPFANLQDLYMQISSAASNSCLFPSDELLPHFTPPLYPRGPSDCY